MTTAKHDCAATREQLIDLLYDELDAREAADLRAAAHECPDCTEHLERLEEGLSLAAALPMAEPSPNFDQRLMALVHQELAGAQSVAAESVAAESPAGIPAENPPSVLSRWADRLRSLVAGPQVAMATLTLLVAALGVWYLPRQQQPVGAGGDTVVSLEPDGEAVATAPAAPATLEAPSGDAPPTRRARRERAAAPEAASGELAGGATMAAASRGGGLDAWRPEGSVSAQRAPATEPGSPAEVLGGGAPMRDEAEAMQAQGYAARATGASGGVGEEDPLAAAEAQPRAQMMDAPVTQRPDVEAPGALTPPAGPTSAARPRRHARSATMSSRGPQRATALDDVMAAGAGGHAVGDRQAYERGLNRYRARDYRGAIDELGRVVRAPSPDARTLVPSALHHIAQSLRASGSCRAAVTRYESLLRRFPGYGQAPTAMMEAADCYRRIGQLSAARRWATRAQSYGATATAARRELLRIDSMESGSGRSRRRPSRAAPAADTAAAVEEAY